MAFTTKPSLFSRLTFEWFNKLMFLGYEKPLSPEDVFPLEPNDFAYKISAEFNRNWSRECATNGKSPSIANALAKSYGKYFVVGALLHLLVILLAFANPQLLKFFITYISTPTSSLAHGLLIAFLFFLISTLKSLLHTHSDFIMSHVSLKTRSALTTLIYRKSLTLSSTSRHQTTSGELINLISTNIPQVTTLFPYINLLWSGLLQVLLAMYFLWLELGFAFLAGFAILLLIIPTNAKIASKEHVHLKRQMMAQDERLKVINEVLNGIKCIKLNGYETPFMRQITDIRAQELVEIKKVGYYTAGISISWSVTPFLVSLVTFTAYLLSSTTNVLDAQKVIVSLALFDMLRSPLARLSFVLADLMTARVAVKRLNRFLNSEELEKYVNREKDENSVTIENASFTWEKEQKPILNDINLKIPKRSLVAIVGHVGSGKSSLLSTILGDMERVDGTVNLSQEESVAYVSQQAWIQNATLRENILFGADFNEPEYNSILEKCALLPDLSILPAGDQTEIGEKGINLSGGQKQRVALARACYSQSSLFLLDDPLAAVDSHVAKHIYQKVLCSSTGILKNTTRILVTTNISILPEVDQIVVLENGKIRETGTYSQLMSKSKKFSELIHEHSKTQTNSDESESSETSQDTPKHKSGLSKSIPMLKNSKLIQTEQTQTGHVPFSVYQHYFQSFTWPCVAIVIFGYITSEVLSVSSNIWLTLWTNANSTSSSQFTSLAIFCLFGIAQAFFITLATLAIAHGNVNSSRSLHGSLLERIMRSPMQFFDTTPIGRITTRFGSDLDLVDATLAYNFDGWLTHFVQVLSFFILVCIKLPAFILVALPISLLYNYIQKFYIATSRQLKRIEMVHKSPIVSHFSETLSGVSTIRASETDGRFLAQFNQRLDAFQRCFYCNSIADRWLALRLELCGNLIMFSTVVLAILSRNTFSMEPAIVGLIITFTLPLTETLSSLVKTTSAVQKNVVAVERIAEYCLLESERDWTREENQNPTVVDGWPKEGAIEFVDYSVRYRNELDSVLNSVNVKIGAGEKVGIVGRTGAGKSSLTLALFRILEADKGLVKIDGIDTAQLGLHELRHRLAIIPQDPVLFSGTIRSNLDPFGVYRDNLLLTALSQCHMRQFVDSTNSGLDYPIAENGSNLSVGQRQLICLGRALLRRTKILVLDEATAAIDIETDALIQQTIRREFDHCTVLTIAHRLPTILDSDRVIVLDGGKVAEFDSPATLLKNTKSMFYALAKNARLV